MWSVFSSCQASASVKPPENQLACQWSPHQRSPQATPRAAGWPFRLVPVSQVGLSRQRPQTTPGDKDKSVRNEIKPNLSLSFVLSLVSPAHKGPCAEASYYTHIRYVFPSTPGAGAEAPPVTVNPVGWWWAWCRKAVLPALDLEREQPSCTCARPERTSPPPSC